jgi:hypothetical protein
VSEHLFSTQPLNALCSKIPISTVRNIFKSQVLVAHSCNPSYSGGSDQGDLSLKPAQPNSSRDPILKKKKTITKIGLVEWHQVKALN